MSAQNVQVVPKAGLTLVEENADSVFVSVFTAVLIRRVVRLYCVVIRRRRCVNDCISAWPTINFAPCRANLVVVLYS